MGRMDTSGHLVNENRHWLIAFGSVPPDFFPISLCHLEFMLPMLSGNASDSITRGNFFLGINTPIGRKPVDTGRQRGEWRKSRLDDDS